MVNAFQVSSVFSFVATLLVGIIVFTVNPTRRANRHFLTMSCVLGVWFLCMIFGSFAGSSKTQLFWVRQSHFWSLALPLVFDLLRLSIAHADRSWRYYWKSLRPFILILFFGCILAQSDSFVHGLRHTENGVPLPVFGHGQVLYLAAWLVALAFLVSNYTRDLCTLKGMPRTELQFVLLAAIAAVTTGLSLGHFIPLATRNQDVTQLLPLCILPLNGVLAYGIATRHIMDVGEVLRRSTAYALLIGYLTILYFIVKTAAALALTPVLGYSSTLPGLIAAMTVAFSMAPANGWMQRFANRLFINLRPVDIRSAVERAQEAMLSIGTTDQMLSRFAEIARDVAGTDHVRMLLMRDHVLDQAFPVPAPKTGLAMSCSEALPDILIETKTPVSLDGLRRQRPTARASAAIAQMETAHAELAIGVRTKGVTQCLVFFGRRLSGRIYSAHEQSALQFFCDHIGVALENAALYTAVQNGKIYNDILLDSLISGVIAVNADGRVTVFNREAARITGLKPEDIVEQPMDGLPAPILGIMQRALQSGSSHWDQQATILRGNKQEEVPVKLSGSTFHSHTGEAMGILVVLTDQSIVRQLEEQVRRTDRLASLGTLSAGMAHEIKNPLVSIKTFTQLLPERYDDEEFRSTFSVLIGQEVQRIDSIVNRLLHFARPAKAALARMHLHEALSNSLHLIDQQLRRYNIELKRHFLAERDEIEGDTDLLNQTFVNFFLNAIAAMEQGGALTVATALGKREQYALATGENGAQTSIRVSIIDTGHGIKPEHLPRIFDPFFTTKSVGTGLGLSVSHGIIQEHSATVDVESEPGVGTTFHLTFPLKPAASGEEDTTP